MTRGPGQRSSNQTHKSLFAWNMSRVVGLIALGHLDKKVKVYLSTSTLYTQQALSQPRVSSIEKSGS